LRLGRLFDRESGRSFITAFDHGTTLRIPPEVGKPLDLLEKIVAGEPVTMAEVVEGCPVPVLTLGGARGGEGAVVEAARGAIEGGAKGLIFGRNVWQAGDPVRMTASLREVVHGVAYAKK
jgi:DhnA family fructose-bisphosphate aldolase class Ia